jgi:hypothetical protein
MRKSGELVTPNPWFLRQRTRLASPTIRTAQVLSKKEMNWSHNKKPLRKQAESGLLGAGQACDLPWQTGMSARLPHDSLTLFCAFVTSTRRQEDRDLSEWARREGRG